MQHNTPSEHTGEQEPAGPGHRRRTTANRAGTRRATEGQERTNTPWVGRTGATQPTHRASGRSGTPRPLVRARPGCIGDHGKRHLEPWKQPVTGEPVHSPGGGHLLSRVAPQLKPQG